MKLRPELFLVPVVAGVLWLVLDAGGPRAGRGSGGVSGDARAGSGATRELEGARPTPVLAPGPTAAVEARSPLPVEAPANGAGEPRRGCSLGRLVDEATLEPIPEALVATSRRNDWTDANGWFDTGDALDGLAGLLVVNVAQNTRRQEVPRERWTRLASAWQVPLAIGPTFRLRFTSVEDPETRAWEGRLRQERGGEEHWSSLRKGPPPYLRYDEPVHGLVSGVRTWLEVRTQDRLFEGRAEVRALTGVQELTVDGRARAVLRGRVVDESGAPRSGIPFDAVQVSPAGVERLSGVTLQDGSYQLDAAEPGRMRVHFSPPDSTQRHRIQLDVPRGVTRASEVVLAGAAPLGSIRGILQSRSGARVANGTVRVRALDGSGYERVQTFYPRMSRTPQDQLAATEFLFEAVPGGSFELSVVSEQGFPWSPTTLGVQAPAAGIVFTADDALPLLAYSLDVRDAETGAALGLASACVHSEGASLSRAQRLEQGALVVELAERVAFEWSVTAPGYGLAHGSERDFRVPPGGEATKRTATVELRHGFGARMALLDCEALGRQPLRRGGQLARWSSAGLDGVVVLADGMPVAVSDERGTAELDLPAEPGRIELRLPGWRVLDSPDFRDGRVQSHPEAEVWMVRE